MPEKSSLFDSTVPQGLRIDPGLAWGWDQLGFILLSLEQQYQAARSCFQRSIQ
jgi:hypothetical protein